MVEALKTKYGDRFLFQAYVSREVVEGSITGRIPITIKDGSLEESVGLNLT